jgi:hypothetical protein
METFSKGNFEELEKIVVPDLVRELENWERLTADSQLMEGFKADSSQRMGYMAASCNHFSLALKAFEIARKSDFNSTILIEDDKLVANAYIGQIEKAVTISADLIRMLETKKSDQTEFWKLFYIPWESTSKIKGSVSMGPQAWPKLAYELQHATLLLSKKIQIPLTESERDFLSNFEIRIDDKDVKSQISEKLPLHRLLAYYLKLMGRVEEAEQILQILISKPSVFSALQVQCAEMDIHQLKSENRR